MRRVEIRTWFREDIPAAIEKLEEVYEEMRRRADAPVEEAFIACGSSGVRELLEVLATVGPRVGVNLWLDPDGDPYVLGYSLYRLGGSAVLNAAMAGGTARLGRPVGVEATS